MELVSTSGKLERIVTVYYESHQPDLGISDTMLVKLA